MQMRRSKADQTMEGIGIILSNISKATAFIHQRVISIHDSVQTIHQSVTPCEEGSGFQILDRRTRIPFNCLISLPCFFSLTVSKDKQWETREQNKELKYATFSVEPRTACKRT